MNAEYKRVVIMAKKSEGKAGYVTFGRLKHTSPNEFNIYVWMMTTIHVPI